MTTSLETAGWLVDWRLAGRAGFPAAVHPEPLRGVAADGVLQYGVEAGGVGGGVGFGVAGLGQCDLGIEVEDVATLGLVPEEKAGEDNGAGLERDAGEAGGGAGRNAEERRKETLRRRHVGVHEDADGVAGAHGGD